MIDVFLIGSLFVSALALGAFVLELTPETIFIEDKPTGILGSAWVSREYRRSKTKQPKDK